MNVRSSEYPRCIDCGDLFSTPQGLERHVSEGLCRGQSNNDDAVDSPAHYNAHPSGVECITVTEHMNFCLGNAIKYLWRAQYKGGLEDLKKARWYIDREIARIEKS